jgi:peptidyl-prolyl cis-trans isomerase SurA
MQSVRKVALPLALLVGLSAIPGPSVTAADETEPDRVVVQHLLIGFKRSVPSKKLERTKKEARALAEKLYQRAVDGEDFGKLVEEYTDDSYPGLMSLTNRGAPLRGDSRSRDGVVPGFGDASFALEVGEITLVKYSYGASPYGWHIIKRLE